MHLNVEVFSSPGCGKCGQAREILRKLVEESGESRITWREVDILNEIDYAVKLGILTTPAIAFNGKLVFTGLPSSSKLQKKIQSYLDMDTLPNIMSDHEALKP